MQFLGKSNKIKNVIFVSVLLCVLDRLFITLIVYNIENGVKFSKKQITKKNKNICFVRKLAININAIYTKMNFTSSF